MLVRMFLNIVYSCFNIMPLNKGRTVFIDKLLISLGLKQKILAL